MPKVKTKKTKRRFTLAQKIGLGIMIVALVVPASFWGILLVMDLTKNYCSECGIGWAAVIYTMLAIPAMLIGLLTFGIATLAKASKQQES